MARDYTEAILNDKVKHVTKVLIINLLLNLHQKSRQHLLTAHLNSAAFRIATIQASHATIHFHD